MSRLNEPETIERVAQTVQLKFLHMSFAPEAQRKLAGGGEERNHRMRVKIYSQPRRSCHLAHRSVPSCQDQPSCQAVTPNILWQVEGCAIWQDGRGDRPKLVCRPSRAPAGDFDCIRWFHPKVSTQVSPLR